MFMLEPSSRRDELVTKNRLSPFLCLAAVSSSSDVLVKSEFCKAET
jgi:hypothetical protein